MAEKPHNADSGKEIKKINKKEKTIQQQKGLPTLSVDLNDCNTCDKIKATLQSITDLIVF